MVPEHLNTLLQCDINMYHHRMRHKGNSNVPQSFPGRGSSVLLVSIRPGECYTKTAMIISTTIMSAAATATPIITIFLFITRLLSFTWWEVFSKALLWRKNTMVQRVTTFVSLLSKTKKSNTNKTRFKMKEIWCWLLIYIFLWQVFPSAIKDRGCEESEGVRTGCKDVECKDTGCCVVQTGKNKEAVWLGQMTAWIKLNWNEWRRL